MKLVLYSGGTGKENREMDSALQKMLPKDPIVTFIPSSSFEAGIYFREYVKRFQKYGFQRFLNFPVDVPFDSVLEEQVWESDWIHLDGGNTFYFLASLRKKKLLGKLRAFVKQGGVLSGESAGAILQTPNISTAGFPEFDRDDNDVHLTNLSALNLVSFEFAPHFVNSKRYQEAYLNHTKKTSIPLYACKDGGGIIINGSSLQFVGKTVCFLKGRKLLHFP